MNLLASVDAHTLKLSNNHKKKKLNMIIHQSSTYIIDMKDKITVICTYKSQAQNYALAFARKNNIPLHSELHIKQ